MQNNNKSNGFKNKELDKKIKFNLKKQFLIYLKILIMI